MVLFPAIALSLTPVAAQYSSNPFVEHAKLKAYCEMGFPLSDSDISRLHSFEEDSSFWLGEDFQAAIKAASAVIESGHSACSKICDDQKQSLDEKIECFQKCTEVATDSVSKIEDMLSKHSDVSISNEMEKAGIVSSAINVIKNIFNEQNTGDLPQSPPAEPIFEPSDFDGFNEGASFAVNLDEEILKDDFMSPAPGSDEWMNSAGGLFDS